MVNYGKGKIYKIEPICEHDAGEIYIGSTTKDYLSQRMDRHRSAYKQWLKGKGRKVMSYDLFINYGVENCKIVLLESVIANSKDELASREAYYMKILKCVNKQIPMAIKNIGQKEYSRHYSHLYNIQNKESIRANKNRKYCCECGCRYTHSNKLKHFKTAKHQNYIKKIQITYEYFWEDGTPCSKDEYEQNIQY